MKSGTRALLFSAFVFPGTGHLIQKRKLRGWIFIATEIILMILFIRQTVQVALGAMTQLETGGTALDLNALTTVATDAVATSGPVLALFLRLIFAVWIVSIVDTWWAGRTKIHS